MFLNQFERPRSASICNMEVQSNQVNLKVIRFKDDLLPIRPLGTYFSENLFEIQKFSSTKMHSKMWYSTWRPIRNPIWRPNGTLCFHSKHIQHMFSHVLGCHISFFLHKVHDSTTNVVYTRNRPHTRKHAHLRTHRHMYNRNIDCRLPGERAYYVINFVQYYISPGLLVLNNTKPYSRRLKTDLQITAERQQAAFSRTKMTKSKYQLIRCVPQFVFVFDC